MSITRGELLNHCTEHAKNLARLEKDPVRTRAILAMVINQIGANMGVDYGVKASDLQSRGVPGPIDEQQEGQPMAEILSNHLWEAVPDNWARLFAGNGHIHQHSQPIPEEEARRMCRTFLRHVTDQNRWSWTPAMHAQWKPLKGLPLDF